ncbi:hypothetical protein EOM82_00355 [bacterium]|nr:hypothetical protein [bacterium]
MKRIRFLLIVAIVLPIIGFAVFAILLCKDRDVDIWIQLVMMTVASICTACLAYSVYLQSENATKTANENRSQDLKINTYPDTIVKRLEYHGTCQPNNHGANILIEESYDNAINRMTHFELHIELNSIIPLNSALIEQVHLFLSNREYESVQEEFVEKHYFINKTKTSDNSLCKKNGLYIINLFCCYYASTDDNILCQNLGNRCGEIDLYFKLTNVATVCKETILRIPIRNYYRDLENDDSIIIEIETHKISEFVKEISSNKCDKKYN